MTWFVSCRDIQNSGTTHREGVGGNDWRRFNTVTEWPFITPMPLLSLRLLWLSTFTTNELTDDVKLKAGWVMVNEERLSKSCDMASCLGNPTNYFLLCLVRTSSREKLNVVSLVDSQSRKHYLHTMMETQNMQILFLSPPLSLLVGTCNLQSQHRLHKFCIITIWLISMSSHPCDKDWRYWITIYQLL